MLSEGTRYFAKVAAGLLVLMWGVSLVSDWTDRREMRRAESAELRRREAMTSEQRVAEDQAKATREAIAQQQAAADRAAAEKPRIEASALIVCSEVVRNTLRDPDSARLQTKFFYRADDGQYRLHLEGRAKNGFGGYSGGEWLCDGSWNGSRFTVSGLKPLQP